MIFDFSTGFRFSKVSVECSVHICRQQGADGTVDMVVLAVPMISIFWSLNCALVSIFSNLSVAPPRCTPAGGTDGGGDTGTAAVVVLAVPLISIF